MSLASEDYLSIVLAIVLLLLIIAIIVVILIKNGTLFSIMEDHTFKQHWELVCGISEMTNFKEHRFDS